MNRFRALWAALVVGGFVVGVSFADDKKPGERTGRLPAGYGKLFMSDPQKQEVYRIQAEYKTRIKALEEKIAALKKEEKMAIAKLLTPVQKARLKEMEAEQAALDVKKGKAK